MKKQKCFLFFLLLAFSLSLDAQNEKFKALFMYNFTKYIEWPSSTRNGDFVIGILGSSPLTAELKTIAGKQKVGSQSIVVKVFETVDEIQNCQILFIPAAKSTMIGSVLTKTSGLNTLIVSEKEGMASQGAGINYVSDGSKLKYEICKSNIQKHGLTVSSSLLSLGIEVN